MANCGDLERGLRDMNRRIGDLERRLGGGSSGSGGAGNNNFDEERIIRKALERVFKDSRWMQAVGILGMLSTGKAGITSLGSLQSPASVAWQRGIEALNRSYQASSAASAAKGKAAEALSKSIDSQLAAKAAKQTASSASSAANGVKRTADQAKKAADASKALSELNKKNITKEAQKLTQEITKKTKPLQDASKKLQDAYKKVDSGVQRLTKGLDKFAAAAGIGFGIAGVVISFMALWSSERNQAAFDRQIDRFQIDMSKQYGILQQFKSRIDKIIKRTDVLEREADLVSDAVKKARSIADAAKKQANDITYEARVRLQRLNDIAAEARSNASKALVQQTAIKQQVSAVETKTTNALNEAQQARVGVRLVDSKATLAAADAKQARIGVQLVDSKATTALVTAQQLPAKIPAIVQSQITPAIAPIKTTNAAQDGEIAALKNRVTAIQNTPKTNTPTPNTPNNASLEIIKPLVNQAVNNSISGYGILPRLGAAEIKADAALRQSQAALTKPELEPIGNRALGLGANNAAAIAKLDNDIQQLSKAPSVLEPRVTAVEAKVREREKMDAVANAKLDYQKSQLEQLLIATGGIGLILPRILGGLDGLPDKTATAVAATPCNGKGCGGKTAQRVDDLAGEVGAIRQQVNNLPNTVGNVVNAGANAVQIPLLNTINSKLGAPVPGGLGGLLSNVSQLVDNFSKSFERFAKWSQMDRALNLLSTIATLHNAYMLSNGLTQTLFSMISNSLAVFGIKDYSQDKDGQPFDVGKIFNDFINNVAKAALGTETVDGIKTEWKKYNRIYQAASNILSSFQSIGYSILGALEIVANWNALVANALKKFGVVGERAYKWFNPEVNFQNRFFTAIDEAENFVSNVDQVAQEVLSIEDTVGQFKTQEKELKESLAQLDGSPQRAQPPEAAKVAVGAATEKSTSASPPISPADQVKPES